MPQLGELTLGKAGSGTGESNPFSLSLKDFLAIFDRHYGSKTTWPQLFFSPETPIWVVLLSLISRQKALLSGSAQSR